MNKESNEGSRKGEECVEGWILEGILAGGCWSADL